MILGLVGLPRSGKSTFKKWLCKEYNFVDICKDDIRLDLYGQRFYEKGDPYVHAIANTMLGVLTKQNINIIIDETSLTIKSRKILQSKCHQEIKWVYFNTDSSICKQRAIDTKQNDLLQVIDYMKDNMEIDTLDKFIEVNEDGIFVNDNEIKTKGQLREYILLGEIKNG